MSTAEPRRNRPDPTDIFSNRVAASAPTAATHAAGTRAHTEVIGPNGDLVTDDPAALVDAVVRPNHNYGGIPSGVALRVPFAEFEREQAALCTPAEYARITKVAASPQHQNLQRQLQAMREAESESFWMGLSDDKRQELLAARARARADEERADRQRQEMAQAAAEARAVQSQPAPRAVPRTEQALEEQIQKIREGYATAARSVGEHGAAALRTAEEQEIADLRAAFAEEQMLRQINEMGSGKQPIVAAASIEERLAKLAALHAKGLVTKELYERRQAEILDEV